MSGTYQILLDDAPGGSSLDISADVLSAEWSLGLRNPYDVVSAPTRGEIMVQRPGSYFQPETSPGSGGAPLQPGTRMRVSATLGSTTYTLFTGWIDRVEPQAGDLSNGPITIVLGGPEQRLDMLQARIPLLTNTQAGAVLQALLDDSSLDRFDRTLDTGVSIFAYAGDTWPEGLRARSAIRQITEAERGRFFTDRNGAMIFYDRSRLPTTPTKALFFNDYAALDYRYGDPLVNQVRVGVRPRVLGTAGSVIWQLGSALFVDADECRTITARLEDSAGTPVGAINVISPVAVTDYQANELADGSGVDRTADVTVTIQPQNIFSNAIDLEVCNTGPDGAYLLVGAQLRGQTLVQGDALTVESTDAASVQAHGLYALSINLPYFVTADEAQLLAAEIVTARKTPSGAVRSMTLNAQTRLTEMLSLTLFDRVRLIESRTGHDREYHIIAEQHRIDLGDARHVTSWTLEPI